MLTYYILSDGKHPFGDAIVREMNILSGKYSLNDVQDKKSNGSRRMDDQQRPR